MEDIPQPASEPYSVGEKVQIYIESADPDSKYNNMICEVLEVFTDDLGTETKRNTDSYSYILLNIESDEDLPISFRHRDLVPFDDSQ
ncbi:hypothetical protein M0R89_06070 [Halorussus limi]|uniref:DUF8139 domain-containing protein n=2 Tax=Halorussus TaxID=1070314 RepID=A0A8U0IKN8_9EURY|nr:MULTISPECIES: hypothetical protein [Halorussus]UPV75628.1 hypothetical protein M0R89_06070 [Halorussus limi]UPW01700.1 hypothetical protein M0R88_06255 [Halorussus gelatinilyticus]